MNSKRFCIFLLLPIFLVLSATSANAALIVDAADSSFHANVGNEISAMRDGRRGIVCKELILRLESATAVTTVRPITLDESTWHPNDRKGTRGHIVPLDTRMRTAARSQPTSCVIYIHPQRMDPRLSLFRLGAHVTLLATAADLNMGLYSGNPTLREKRVSFFRNAWCDAMGVETIQISNRIPTPEYQKAKKNGWLTADFARFFPILSAADIISSPSPSPSPEVSPRPSEWPSPIAFP